MVNDEVSIKDMTVEATELGLAPGVWPDKLDYKGQTWEKEYETRADNGKGEVQYVEYATRDDAGLKWKWLILYRD